MANNIQPLRPFMQFVLDNNQLTKEAYDFLYNMFIRVGGSLSSLNAALLLDKTWAEPAPIGNITPASGKFTTLESTLSTTVGTTLTAGSDITTNGELICNGFSKGLRIRGGADNRVGRTTLVAGNATVNNITITANTLIFLTTWLPGGTPGFLRVGTTTVGTGFTIVSSSATDTSTVNWLLIEQF